MSSSLPRIRRTALLLLTLSVIAATLLSSSEAIATFPGTNGKITFSSATKPKSQVWVMNHNGTNKSQLTSPPRDNSQPSWLAGGDRMVFTSVVPKEVSQIFAMNANGTLRTQVTTGNRNWDHPTMNRAGTKIVASGLVGGYWNLFRMNADGTHQVRLTNTRASDLEATYEPNPLLGSERIAFTRYRDNGAADVMTKDAQNNSDLFMLTRQNKIDMSPSWSPDGLRLAYTHVFGVKGTGRIWTMNANSNGSGKVAVTSNPAGTIYANPVWSPDGLKMAYIRWDGSQPQDIYTMNANATGHERLTDGQFAPFDLDWGPAAP